MPAPTYANLAAGGGFVVDTCGLDVAVLALTGVFAGHNATFDGSIDNGATWITVSATRTNAATLEAATGVLAAAPLYGWRMDIRALTRIRVRVTALTSGSPRWQVRLA